MNRIVIEVKGGLVQAVHSDQDIQIKIIDFDTEGMDKKDLTNFRNDIQTKWLEPDTNNVDDCIFHAVDVINYQIDEL